MNKILISAILAYCLLGYFTSNKKTFKPDVTKTQWVETLYKNMSIQEKVGQLFMIAAYSNREASHVDSIQKLIKNNHIGGLIFFQGGPVRQAKLTNAYQAMSKVPLLIGMDAEWGLNMRLDSTVGFPYNMTLGAIKDDDLIKRIGGQLGKDCKRLGVHLNFAPVVDINTNSKNPIIGVRSFGEDKFNVTKKALAFTEGLQNEGVMACAKHFPGHGDTDTDSHKALPTVSFSKERIDSVELYPYKELFKKGIAGVMVAHLNVPSLEPTEGLPSSLSFNVVSNILKQQLAYKGLVFTDALNMKGAANYKQPGDVDLAAFKAGNDVLLFTENAPKAILKIIEAYKNNDITEERLAHSVKKILAAKFDVGLNRFAPIKLPQLINDLNKDINNVLYEEVIKNAITVIKNKGGLLPINSVANQKIAFIKLGDGNSDVFLNMLKSNNTISNLTDLSLKELEPAIKEFEKVIIGYHRSNSRDSKPISNTDKEIIEAVSKEKNVILNVFASQYALKELSFANTEAVIISYENSEVAQIISAQIMLGNLEVKGKLPATLNDEFATNFGIGL